MTSPLIPNPAAVLSELLAQVQSVEVSEQPHQSHGRWYSHLLIFHLRAAAEPIILPLKIPAPETE